MKRKLLLTLILAAVAIAFTASLQPDATVYYPVFQAEFLTALQNNGFRADVRLEPLGPRDTPFSPGDANVSVPFAVKWNPRRWYPHLFAREFRSDFRIALRDNSSTVVCSVVVLDGSASFILIRSQPDAMPVANSLRTLLVHELPDIAIQIRTCAPSRSVTAAENPKTPAPDKDYPKEKFLSLTPDLSKATLMYGRVTIPFSVKNIYTEDIVFLQHWHDVVDLMTVDDAGKTAPIDYFRRRDFEIGGGPMPQRIVFKPGESGTYPGNCSMETLAFLADRNKKLVGNLTGSIARTSDPISAFSAPFAVPPELSKQPWRDLGKKDWFTVKLGGIRVDEWVVAGGCVVMEVVVTNKTNQEYIAVRDSVIFYHVGDGSAREPMSPWESVKATKPIVMPGASAICGSRPCIGLPYYKPGDIMIAVVAGRVPNTNEIFKCYSTPFVLPPLPKPD